MIRALGVALLLTGCSPVLQVLPPDLGAQQPPADMAEEVEDIRCLGRAQDVGKVIWWVGVNHEPQLHYADGYRFVCKDHGPDHDGWWWERNSDGRLLP